MKGSAITAAVSTIGLFSLRSVLAVAGVALLAAVAWNLGYMTPLGLNFLPVLGLGDYGMTALLVLPLAALGYIFYVWAVLQPKGARKGGGQQGGQHQHGGDRHGNHGGHHGGNHGGNHGGGQQNHPNHQGGGQKRAKGRGAGFMALLTQVLSARYVLIAAIALTLGLAILVYGLFPSIAVMGPALLLALIFHFAGRWGLKRITRPGTRLAAGAPLVLDGFLLVLVTGLAGAMTAGQHLNKAREWGERPFVVSAMDRNMFTTSLLRGLDRGVLVTGLSIEDVRFYTWQQVDTVRLRMDYMDNLIERQQDVAPRRKPRRFREASYRR